MKKGIIITAGSIGALSLLFFANVQKSEAHLIRPPKPAVYKHVINQYERRERIWENCDYEAWKEYVKNRPVTEKINKDNFEEFCHMHLLANNGRFRRANEIRKDLELPRPPHPFHPWWR